MSTVRDRPAARLLWVLVLWVMVLVPFPAEAHNDLVASSPRAGDVISMTNRSLILVFDDELSAGAAQVVVRDPDGEVVDATAPVVSGGKVEMTLSLSAPGRHEVAYRIVGGDGHPVVGSFVFDVIDTDVDAGPPGGLDPPAAAVVANSSEVSSPGADRVTAVGWLVAVAAMLGAAALVRRSANRLRRRG